jgi:hypothetical protein
MPYKNKGDQEEYDRKRYLENKEQNKEHKSKIKKLYRGKNKKKISKYQKDYYVENKEVKLKQCKEYKAKVQEEKPEVIMLGAAKQRAKKKGLICSITTKDIIIPERCPYLGIFLERCTKNTARDSSPSLDRIDSSKGYIPGNIQVISNRANRIKNNATADELIMIGNCMKLQELS